MTCPRCGRADVEGPICPACGVVFAKLKDADARPDRRRTEKPLPETREAPPRRGPSVLALVAFALLAAAAGWLFGRRSVSTPAETPKTPPPIEGTTQEPRRAEPLLPRPPVLGIPLPAAAGPTEGSISPAAKDTAEAISRRLLLRAPMSAADLEAAEGLVRLYPDEPRLRELLLSTTVTIAEQERRARHYESAASAFRKAIALRPKDVAIRLSLVGLLLEADDFKGAEAASREALALDPTNGDAFESLADALFRQ